MKKAGLIIFVVLSLLPLALALNLEVKKIDKGSVIIKEIGNPSTFDFLIKNNGDAENAEIYSLLGILMSPRGRFDIPPGESTLEVKVYPNKEMKKVSGFYIFEYQIRGQGADIFKDTLAVKMVGLGEAIEISAKNLNPGDNLTTISIRSIENTNLEEINIKLNSAFFESSQTLSLKPYEERKFNISINKEKLRKLNAGVYVITADISLGDAEARTEGVINYLEKEGTSVKEDSEGIIIRKYSVIKTNEGNVPVLAKIESNKDLISRLFTIHNIKPTNEERNWLIVKYSWEKELKPGESFEVKTTTNYTFPFILLLIVFFASVAAQKYYRTNVVLDKRVNFVKTKGGEFALKIRLHIKAKKSVNNVKIIDRLPASAHLYDKFSKPDKFDSGTRRLIWNISKLNAGEERIFSYIIYSKLKIIGRYELPKASAIFEQDEKSNEIFSNKTYFMNEIASG